MRAVVCACTIAFCALLQSCGKDKPPSTPAAQPQDSTHAVLVACEGSYGSGNAGLSYYAPVTGTAIEDVYKAANGIGAGDVLQSITDAGDRWLLCVNNSDKIVAIRKSDYHITGSLSIPKPRYIRLAAPGKAYVSTLFSNRVFVIDPQAMTVLDTLRMPWSNPEGMLLSKGLLYVCCWDTAATQVAVLDVATDALIPGSFLTLQGRAPQEILEDKNGALWVLGGNAPVGYTASLARFSAGSAPQYFTFPAGADALRPCLNPTADTLYWIEANYTGGTENNGIFRMDIGAATLPAWPFIQAQQLQYFWALGIDPSTGYVYVGDPKGFIQKGSVAWFNPQGNLLGSFATGVGPGHIVFVP